MKSFSIKIEPTNYIFEVFGDESAETELHWSGNPPVGRAKGAFAVVVTGGERELWLLRPDERGADYCDGT